MWEMLPAEIDDFLLGRVLRPAPSVTKALGRSPHFSSGMATTAHSSTTGWRQIVFSTSMVEMFSPPEMMTSFIRSRTSM